MSEEINSIVNNLCDKLGTSAKLLIPELAKLRIAESVTVLIIFSLFLLLGAIFIKISFKLYDEDDDTAEALVIIGAVTMLIGAVGVAVDTCTLVGWLASPTAKAILEIIRMVK